MKVKTKIVKSLNGHTVRFTIGVQTFSLRECEPQEGLSSKKYAEWYKKQLDTAFKDLLSKQYARL